MALVEHPYKVVVVLDRDYGERLSEVASGVPIWVIDTPPNRAVAERRWAERPEESHLTSITTFKAGSDCSPEEIFLGKLETIDMHHGKYSAQPPYTILEVIGASLNDRIKVALAKIGFDVFKPSANGFCATRPLPEPDGRVC